MCVKTKEMKAFTVHDVFKIARFTDESCTTPKRYYEYNCVLLPVCVVAATVEAMCKSVVLEGFAIIT
jgi:hypothetical protein